MERLDEPQDSGHIRALDGIRGFAVLLVFVLHSVSKPLTSGPLPLRIFIKVTSLGWIGVDLFFVLSGFLITTILLNARSSANYYSVFYIRRALRIFPLYYLVLTLTLVLSSDHYGWKSQIWFWLNLSNIPTAFYPFLIPSLAHFWSLGLEEQFYFLWPTVVRRLSTRGLLKFCVVGMIIVSALRNVPWVLHTNAHIGYVYRLPMFRFDTLLAGALVAICASSARNLIPSRMSMRIVGCVSFVVFVLLTKDPSSEIFTRFGYTMLLVALTCLVTLSLYTDGWTSKFFGGRFLRMFGRYSYAIYLFHPFLLSRLFFRKDAILSFLEKHLHVAHLSWSVVVISAFPFELFFVTVLAAISWRILEEPLLAYKKHFRYLPRPDHLLA